MSPLNSTNNKTYIYIERERERERKRERVRERERDGVIFHQLNDDEVMIYYLFYTVNVIEDNLHPYQCKTHTHTHTHTYIYIYIYMYISV